MRLAAAIAITIGLTAPVFAQTSPLHIVVIDGENAVNVIERGTAVRPVVEVRDANNLPVSGANVTFAIDGNARNASFAGGARTATATTDAVGRATSGSVNPLSAGTYRIQVEATYRGATASATIAQTTVATAAAAAAIGAGAVSAGASAGAAGAGSGAAGAVGGAAAGGGGLSTAATVGIVAGAIGGGAVAAKELVGNNSSSDKGGNNGNVFEAYTGSPSGQLVFTNIGTNPPSFCTSTRSVTGTIRFEFQNGVGKTGATARVEIIQTETSVVGDRGCIPATVPATFTVSGDVTGPANALAFSGTSSGTGSTSKFSFNGSQSGTTIVGTATIEVSTSNGGFNGSGSATIPITLNKE